MVIPILKQISVLNKLINRGGEPNFPLRRIPNKYVGTSC